MEISLFKKYQKTINNNKEIKEDIINEIKKRTSITLQQEEIIIKNKKIILQTTSSKKVILLRCNIEKIVLEKGYTINY